MKRSGFTLVEMLVVVVIIGILAALLFPAVSTAVQRAREAEVVAEIKNFEAAIAQFKNRYGIEPPSFIVLYENGAGQGNPDWNTDTVSGMTDAHRRVSRAAIRQMWPDFDFTYGNGSIDMNNNGTTNDVLVLNGAECLAFFVGGITRRITLPDGSQGWEPLGFCSNPQYPFRFGGNRIGPFLEMKPDRLIDVDATMNNSTDEAMPEYLDTLRGQRLPYQYLSSYEGRGYQPYGLDYNPVTGVNLTFADDELMQGASFPLQRMYYQSPPFTPADPLPPDARPHVQNTFQIISPGQDGEFGFGGYYNGSGLLGDNVGRDNITNFSGGRLN